MVLALVAVVVLVGVGVAGFLVLRGEGSFTAVPLGTSEGPATEPTDEVWSVPLSEEGLTTLIAGEDVVLVTEDAVAVQALDAGDGDVLWSVELGGSDFDRAVPLAGGMVLLEDEQEPDEPTTRLVDARTGEELWEAEGEIPTIYRDHTSAEATSIHDLDVVLLADGGGLVAVDRETGEVRWELDDRDDVTACGGVLVTTGDAIGEGFGTEVVDPVSGDEVWTADGRAGPCWGGRVAVAEGSTVTVREAAEGTEVGQVELTGDEYDLVATPVGDHVLVQGGSRDAGGVFMAVHPLSGDEPVYEAEGSVASPVGDGSVLFATPVFGRGGGTFVRVADGEEVATTESEESRTDDCFAAVAPEQIVVCTGGDPVVTAHSVEDGSVRWSLDVDDEATHAVVMIGDRLIRATADRVTAYRA